MYYVPEENCKHILFGATYDPKDANEYIAWDNMIPSPFKGRILVNLLDIPLLLQEFEGGLVEKDNFIPTLVPVSYAKLWNYNTMLKIDDKDFKASHPGVPVSKFA